MPPTYRVRYSLSPSGQQAASGVRALDVDGDLDGIPARLPAGAYILSIDDLTAGRGVHWTRWPLAYRPGFGGSPPPAGGR